MEQENPIEVSTQKVFETCSQVNRLFQASLVIQEVLPSIKKTKELLEIFGEDDIILSDEEVEALNKVPSALQKVAALLMARWYYQTRELVFETEMINSKNGEIH